MEYTLPSPKSNSNRRLIIVSHSIPLSLKKLKLGVWAFEDRNLSSLVSSVSALKENNVIKSIVWLGCPSQELSNLKAEQKEIVNTQIEENSFCSVDSISNKLYDDACIKFTHHYLRCLFHYNISNVNFDEQKWLAYQEFNKQFAAKIKSIYQENDIIWIHGLQLLLLPQMLRKLIGPSEDIGMFLNVPFPAVEVFRCLPSRKKLLQGMLGANIVGFQTYCYVRYFNQSCTRILGAQVSFEGVKYKNDKTGDTRLTRVSAYAEGIDPREISKCLEFPQVRRRIQELKETFSGKKIIISKDHGEAMEATTRKLLAFEQFLKKNPNWISKVVFFLIVEPYNHNQVTTTASTTSSSFWSNNQTMNNMDTKNINETVARINGEYGKIGMNPIEYIHRSIEYEEMCALFTVAEVFINTPLREGMNLDIHDYVACHNLKVNPLATLILSEFDGSCRCFSGCILVNPYSINQMSVAISDALNLDPKESAKRQKDHLHYVLTNTSYVWCEAYLTDLTSFGLANDQSETESHQLRIKDLEKSILTTTKRLFIFDYDGAFKDLLPNSPQPLLPARIGRILKSIADDPNNVIYVISSRDTETLENLLENVPGVGLGSENGNFLRNSNGIQNPNMLSPNTSQSAINSTSSSSSAIQLLGSDVKVPEWQHLSAGRDMSWKETVVQVLEHFTERLPLSNLEVNKVTVLWSYEQCVSDYALELAQELLTCLMEIAGKTPIDISHNNKNIEIKPSGTGKANAMRKIIDENPNLDFIFCIGDDRTDVELFELLDRDNPNHFPVSVGSKKSYSKYYVPTQKRVLELLESMISLMTKVNSSKNINSHRRSSSYDTSFISSSFSVQKQQQQQAQQPTSTSTNNSEIENNSNTDIFESKSNFQNPLSPSSFGTGSSLKSGIITDGASTNSDDGGSSTCFSPFTVAGNLHHQHHLMQEKPDITIINSYPTHPFVANKLSLSSSSDGIKFSTTLENEPY
ncbi:glycosyltransferase [Tieghemostelium lacteum]|uniref:Glycosyltransferase n=1 Tax=Tieghemostelium lacteum TaxID=361077 RepID=A0A152A0U3_TIELA|nr:glycosyltransferase [Tieghemostelium lacteum]|eukprot:KYQ99845.1 glycosyltransferase [Tieghemostelium lacteum]